MPASPAIRSSWPAPTMATTGVPTLSAPMTAEVWPPDRAGATRASTDRSSVSRRGHSRCPWYRIRWRDAPALWSSVSQPPRSSPARCRTRLPSAFRSSFRQGVGQQVHAVGPFQGADERHELRAAAAVAAVHHSETSGAVASSGTLGTEGRRRATGSPSRAVNRSATTGEPLYRMSAAATAANSSSSTMSSRAPARRPYAVAHEAEIPIGACHDWQVHVDEERREAGARGVNDVVGLSGVRLAHGAREGRGDPERVDDLAGQGQIRVVRGRRTRTHDVRAAASSLQRPGLEGDRIAGQADEDVALVSPGFQDLDQAREVAGRTGRRTGRGPPVRW